METSRSERRRAQQRRYEESERGQAARARREAKRLATRVLKTKHCVICGAEFHPHGTDLTCAENKCRRQHRRNYERRWWDAHRPPRRPRKRTPIEEKRAAANRRNRAYQQTKKGRRTIARSARLRHWRRRFGGTIPPDVLALLTAVWEAGLRLPSGRKDSDLD